MTSSTSESLIFLLIASMVLASTMANMDWQNGFNYTDWGLKHGYYHPNQTQVTPNKIIVGGSKNWQFGVNYTDWARKNGPFYLNDVLGLFILYLLQSFYNLSFPTHTNVWYICTFRC